MTPKFYSRRPTHLILLLLLVLTASGCEPVKWSQGQRCRDQVNGKEGIGCSCVYYRNEQAIYQPVPTAQIRYCQTQPDFEGCLCSGTPRPIN